MIALRQHDATRVHHHPTAVVAQPDRVHVPFRGRQAARGLDGIHVEAGQTKLGW